MRRYWLLPVAVSLILLGAIVSVYMFRGENPSKIVGFNYIPVEKQKNIQKTTVILGGDVMLGRSVEQTTNKSGNYNYPFLEVADYLKKADIAFVNLENPIVENCPARDNGLVFCANPEMLRGLSFAGINVVNLANNHISNYGESGVTSTRKFLAENTIGYTGLGELYVLLNNGTRFGFLGFNRAESMAALSSEDLELVSSSASKVDVLIVAMHWGNEYYDRANLNQREIAKILTENGADVVVGHHPHWIQDWEKIDGTPVYYSLGNFVFDQMWSEKTKEGMLVELIFEGEKIVEEKFVNIYIDKLGQPVLR